MVRAGNGSDRLRAVPENVTHPLLRGSQVFLRPFEPADAEQYSRWRSDLRPMRTAGWGHRGPLGVVESQRAIEHWITNQGKPDWQFVIALLRDSRPVGQAMLINVSPLHRTAEFGIFIGDPADWGQGYGGDALDAVCDFGFGSLDLARIYLHTGPDNTRGLHAYARSGFKVEGTLRSAFYANGRREDSVVMGLLREEWDALSRPRSWDIP